MTRTTAPDAAADPARAAALLRVLELEARWANLPPGQAPAVDRLRQKQHAYEAFAAALAAYNRAYRPAYRPQAVSSTPARLVPWVGAVRELVVRAGPELGGWCPAALVERARRLADRLGARVGWRAAAPVAPAATVAEAVLALDEVARRVGEVAGPTRGAAEWPRAA